MNKQVNLCYVALKFLFGVLEILQMPIAFFSFYDEKGTINCEKKDSFKGLKHNTIMHAWEMLLDEVYRDRME